ncbi:ATP11-like protein [Cynara cardunculus var. scolymus]|uniref:ATP11-like protein n=1 Tax=Cynara cardunculus var. scolymus TaxID=59895 RepID=A0A103XEJ2_CYNCS|nr:ATP11-like protein [Cynara cardunculus var. scolymus]
MQRLATRVSRWALSSVEHCSGTSHSSFLIKRPFFTSTVQRAPAIIHQHTIPVDFLKWGSLGSHRFSSFASGFSPLKHKPLESIIDIERAKHQTPEDLAAIWDDKMTTGRIKTLFLNRNGVNDQPDVDLWCNLPTATTKCNIFSGFHLGRGHIGASMKTKLYHLLEHRAADCRYFVIPVWKGSGYSTMFVQVQMPHILFTGLEDYKARGTQAAPYFTVSHYKEFAETKDLVLIRGDIVFTSKLTDLEAKWLLETAQSFYLNDTRYKLVERFNKQTSEFEFKDVLRALDMPMM